jgi:cytidyltransferase-like protein
MVRRKPIWVYADVVCDLFHVGHVEFFRHARALGDRLVVGVLSDIDVMTYKPAPIMTRAERVAVVRGCRFVDNVLDPPAPLYCTCDFLDRIGADFACHGDDFSPAEIERWYGDLVPAGRVRVIPYTESISSRKIIQRVVERLHNGKLRSDGNGDKIERQSDELGMKIAATPKGHRINWRRRP